MAGDRGAAIRGAYRARSGRGRADRAPDAPSSRNLGLPAARIPKSRNSLRAALSADDTNSL
ncbi:hypothetical protein GD429_21095 [Burkholderia sp. BE17]|nr:hypothetical protein [Burkholderia sp. BE17]